MSIVQQQQQPTKKGKIVNGGATAVNQTDELGFDLHRIVETYASTNGENKFELDSLLALVRAKQAQPEYARRFLAQVKRSVALLNPHQFEASIVHLLLAEVKWPLLYSHDRAMLDLFAEVLVELVSAYTGYTYKCFR